MTNLMSKTLLAATVGLLAIGGGQLFAQSSDLGSPSVTLRGKATAKLSPEQMRLRAEQYIADMQGMLSRVVRLQQVARRQNDVIKLNCVNNKLLQVKQLLNIAESARNDMIVAITAGGNEAHDKFVQVTISKEKVSGLRAESEGCIGEEVVFLGPTKVDVTKPLIIDDPTKKSPFSIAYREGIVDGAGELKIERAIYGTPFY